MKVVRIHEYGSPDVLKYETVEHLSPAAGEILIKVGELLRRCET
jgi:NADPH:quinone reductase-like Zn-dependent oxidoreductase